jgi:hypothetical protein
MIPFFITMVITACLHGEPNACIEITTPTNFASEVQCQIMSQQALAEIMAGHPKRRVARYKCETVSTGRDA